MRPWCRTVAWELNKKCPNPSEDPTHPKKLTGSDPTLADPTTPAVGSRSSPPETDSGGSVSVNTGRNSRFRHEVCT